MPRPPDNLDLVFTIASTTDPGRYSNYSNAPLVLLFSSLKHPDEVMTKEFMQQLLENPDLKKFFDTFPVMAIPNTTNKSILVTNIPIGVYTQLDDHSGRPYVGILDSSVEILELEKIYYDCNLPEKFMGSCEDCIRNDSMFDACRIKQIAATLRQKKLKQNDRYSPPIVTSVKKFLDTFDVEEKGLELAGFKYVTPTYTAHKFGEPMIRRYNSHDFDNIQRMLDERQENAKKSGQERTRQAIFYKTECSVCLLKDGCQPGNKKHSYPLKCCPGAIEYTEKEACEAIVSNERITNPFSDYELGQLLSHCGKLGTIDRFNTAASFNVVPNQDRGNLLVFSIVKINWVSRRNTDFTHQYFSDYKSAVTFLKKHSLWQPRKRIPREMPRLFKAMFFLAAGTDRSGRQAAGFHGGNYYSKAYLEREYKDGITIYCYTRGYCQRRVHLSSFQEYHNEYLHIAELRRNSSKHARRWTFWGR